MTDLIDTTEMYLKTIYELDEEGIVPLRARIAERLGHSGPTVSQTVARMERDGLVVVTGDRHLELTPAGAAKAMRVMRKHRLAERLLTDVIKLDWEYVHTEACRWEHVMSERVEERLVALLDHPHHDPYGNPIPGLPELGDRLPEVPYLEGVQPLTAFMADQPVDVDVVVEIRRLAEPLQVDIDLLARFATVGLLPGKSVTARRSGDVLSITSPGAEIVIDLPDEFARHVFVGSGPAR